jgi:hypothetical protein
MPAAGLVGDMRLSYAKFLELLEGHRIKRIIVYGDMRTAVVEVPHPAYASVAGARGRPSRQRRSHRPRPALVPGSPTPTNPSA